MQSTYLDPKDNTDTISLDSAHQLTEQEPKKLSRSERFKQSLVLAKPVIYVILFDVALPLAIYYILKIWLSVVIALVLSGIPPLLRVIYLFWKHKRVDILGCIIVFSFILSAVLSIISGDARLALLRDSTTTAVISLMFFITMIPLSTKWFTIRPLIFLITQSFLAAYPKAEWTDEHGQFHSMEVSEALWQYAPPYRKFCYVVNGLWAIFLMLEFVAKVVMIQSSLTVDQVVLYGNIMVIVVVIGMSLFTFLYSKRLRRDIDQIVKEFQTNNTSNV
ncbi:hypothetical protein BD560DRAFT_416589 [Blakeslea trispora]|nr:hypothetical protein BD560DRAFT_416589 [Blakeslea trispora]